MSLIIERSDFDQLFEALRRRDLEVIGPTVHNGTIVYDRIEGVKDLPVGWTDEQGPGSYRLVRREDESLFGYVVGPHSLKRFLYPPRITLFKIECSKDGERVLDTNGQIPGFAFVGVRPCEIAAVDIQARVLDEGPSRDQRYGLTRSKAVVIAVNCVEPGGTCFCTSMGTGPGATGGFDLALTEMVADGRHQFLVETGSARGLDLMAEVRHRAAEEAENERARALLTAAAGRMGRTLETEDLAELLLTNPEHPRWQRVGEQCLTCANCTMVCPTCFCATVEDWQSLDGSTAGRTRQWDSCFTIEFSYIHGGSLRTSPAARYRQWMTHKLATWIDQFGSSGCVGCGRCITWCPVGIDITNVAAAIRASEERRHVDA